jgi:hypothetical protein
LLDNNALLISSAWICHRARISAVLVNTGQLMGAVNVGQTFWPFSHNSYQIQKVN